MNKPCLVLYVPVLHEGYLKLFRKYSGKVEGLYLIGRTLVGEATFLEREIRAIADQKALVKMVEALGCFPWVRILGRRSVGVLAGKEVITADETLTRRVAKKYLVDGHVTFEPTFLRWDEAHVTKTKPVGYSRVSSGRFDRYMIGLAKEQARRSSDWWRQIGAVAVLPGQASIKSHNRHVPSEYLPYALGDIRDFVKAGEHSDISSALHAEQALIVEAARRGVSLKGADLYVTTFPCTVCAKLVAYAGFRRCFFASGHATFQGQEILKAKGVEIVLVKK